MLWKMWCFTLQSMGRTNHKFPVYATRNVLNAPEINCTHNNKQGERTSARLYDELNMDTL